MRKLLITAILTILGITSAFAEGCNDFNLYINNATHGLLIVKYTVPGDAVERSHPIVFEPIIPANTKKLITTVINASHHDTWINIEVFNIQNELVGNLLLVKDREYVVEPDPESRNFPKIPGDFHLTWKSISPPSSYRFVEEPNNGHDIGDVNLLKPGSFTIRVE